MNEIEKYRARRDARLKKRLDEFSENDHPRDENGRFTSGGGGGASKPKKSTGTSPASSLDFARGQQRGLSGNITKDINGDWGKKMKEAPEGTEFSVRSSNRWHDEVETFTKTGDGWKYSRSVDGKDMDSGNAPASRIWNSLNDGSIVQSEKRTSEKKEQKTGSQESVPKNKEKFDIATRRLAYTDSDSRATSIIADAMEDGDFSKEDTGKLADGYCERKGYGKAKTKRFKEDVQIRLNETKRTREKYTNELLDKVPNYETEHEFINDMRRARHWEPINNESIKKVFDSYCEYNGIRGTKKTKLFRAIGGEKK